MKCSHCDKGAEFSCSRCKKEHYCSVECQSQNWEKGHKHVCCNYLTIVSFEVAFQCPKLTELLKMMPRLRTLLPKSDFTLFAPTNEAIQAWGGVGNLSGDSLDKFLMHHIVKGTHKADFVKKMSSITPMHGAAIAVVTMNNWVQLGTDFGATIIESVECTDNIVIHKIDEPLLSEYTGRVGDIEQMTIENTNYRRALETTERSQLVLMSLVPGAWVEREVHEKASQFVRFERGHGEVELGGKTTPVSDGDFVMVPAGTKHAIFNIGKTTTKRLQIYTLYSFDKEDGPLHDSDTLETKQQMYEQPRQ